MSHFRLHCQASLQSPLCKCLVARPQGEWVRVGAWCVVATSLLRGGWMAPRVDVDLQVARRQLPLQGTTPMWDGIFSVGSWSCSQAASGSGGNAGLALGLQWPEPACRCQAGTSGQLGLAYMGLGRFQPRGALGPRQHDDYGTAPCVRCCIHH